MNAIKRYHAVIRVGLIPDDEHYKGERKPKTKEPKRNNVSISGGGGGGGGGGDGDGCNGCIYFCLFV